MLIIIKVLLGISLTDFTKDQLINIYLEIMINKVKNYCNIKTIPVALENIIAEMTAALYLKQHGSGQSTQVIVAQAGEIKSETVGDHKIEYVTSGSTSSSSTSITQDIMTDHKAQLNPFRCIRFL